MEILCRDNSLFSNSNYICLRPSLIKCIGVSFVALGILLGNILYDFLGKGINYANLFMALGVLFIIDYKNLFSFKFPSFKKIMLFPLFLQIYILLAFLLSDSTKIASMDSKFTDLFYILFIILLIIALSSNEKNLCWDNAIYPLFYISTIIVFLAVFKIISTNDYNFSNRFVFESGGDPLTFGIGLSICLISFLLIKPRIFFEKILKLCDLIFLVICEMAFQSRTGLLACTIVLIFYIFILIRLNNMNKLKIIKILLILFFVILIICIIVSNNPFLKSIFENLFNFAKRGLFTFFGDSSNGVDASAAERIIYRKRAFEIINSSNFFELLFGNGYMTMYVDIPILQAFLDLGFIGFLLYFSVVIFYPLYNIISYKKYKNIKTKNKNQWLIFSFMAFLAISKQLSSALPYGHDVYWGSVFCIYFCSI